jgi:hypothetical protein
MHELYEKLVLNGGPFDIIFDPEVGPMELQEVGLADRLEYNNKSQFAYAQDLDSPSLWQLISDTAEKLDLREGETEVIDKISEKVYKTFIEGLDLKLEAGPGNWVTFWYDSRVGNLHRQGKLELFIKPHNKELPEKYEFYEAKKTAWVHKVGDECREKYKVGIELEQLSDFIKKRDLLWLLEEVLNEVYDLWDFLEDVNKRIEGR